MRESVLIELSDAALAESLREFARFDPEGLVHEEHGLLLTLGGNRHPGLSFAMRTAPDGPGPEALLAAAHSMFHGRSRGFTVRTRGTLDGDLQNYLSQRPRIQTGLNLGMVRPEGLHEQPLPKGVTLEHVVSPAVAADFRDVVAIAFRSIGVDEAISRHIFHDLRRLLSAHLRAVVVRLEGQPVAAAMVLLARGVAGVYWVGTLPAARGRGLAAHAVRAAHNWAVDHGARAVTLQCAPCHVPFYERIGYRSLVRYPWFMIVNEGDARGVSESPSSLRPRDY